MGSGAFLVEACRYLGEKLEEAWTAHGQMPAIPADQDPLLHARRIVAQRCLYGVDKNPFAVNLAKLSLWLATFAKDHPFTFVDHTLRCGDSLVGLTAHQIEAFHWQPKEEGALLRDLPSRLRLILNARAQILDAADETPYETLAQKLAVTEEQKIDLLLAGDLVVAAFFATDKPKGREARRKELAEKFRRGRARVTDIELENELQDAVRALKVGLRGVTPFHWELEFPEVFRLDEFGRRTTGFDAMVGNPPFLGGIMISASLGDLYLDFLKTYYEGTGNRMDLVGYFFRRAFNCLHSGSAMGLIATKTIAKGDTRAGSLRFIVNAGGRIYSATRRLKWPGTAQVVVSVVHIQIGEAPAEVRCILDGRSVSQITAFLFDKGGSADPFKLAENGSKSFKGYELKSQGFLFDDSDDKASPLRERKSLLERNEKNGERIWPYIGGDELNNSPRHQFHRWVIYFGSMSLAEAQQWPDLLEVLARKVKPEWDANGTEAHHHRYWQFGRPRPALAKAIGGLPNVIVNSLVTSQWALAVLPSNWIYSHSVNVFAWDSYGAFAILQSRVHEIWARFFGSSMKDDLRYTPTDCFETFPFPTDWGSNPQLEQMGETYYRYRAELMVRIDKGITWTYNRFHNKFEANPEILKLRGLHDEMDRAVLDAYGWTDLHPRLDFILDYADEGENENPNGRGRKKPWRYRWVDEDRDEVLARLLELNRTRAEGQAQSDSGAVAKPKMHRIRRSRNDLPTIAQPTLSYEEPSE
jgi:hypothetical protein